MRNTITLFMWGYQPHFRFEVEHKARQVLQTVAPAVEPRALLIGIRSPEKDDGHPVCVEPEDGDWDPTLFFACHARANGIYQTHPDHGIFYGDEPSMRDKPENIRKKSALAAVKEVTSAYDAEQGTESYCGWPGKVSGYYVVPVLQIKRTQVEAYARLPSAIRFGDWESPRSFLEAIIECLLADSTAALGRSEPGRFLGGSLADVPAVLRRAADRLCSAITLTTKDVTFQEVFEPLNIISSILYEGGETVGEIVFAPAASEHVEAHVHFDKPVPLSRHRLARKVVEMSGQNFSCVCHGSEGISGLGSVCAIDGDDVFRVVFTGHYKWDLYYRRLLLMRTAFGVPKLPVLRLNQEEFYSTAHRVFTDFQVDDGRRLWTVIEKSMEQKRGTMLVFSESAAEEARRLRSQSIGIEPTEITSELVPHLSGIDGALLLTPKGVCHAIGVILDGIATDQGDPSRGARYNSAIRYLISSNSRTMCLVVSEDGDVDMLPRLRPQIRKSDIDLRVEALRSKNVDDFHKTINWLEAHRFYLTASDCDVVNREVARIYSAPMDVGELRFDIPTFVADPAMNDSYYLPEG